MSSMEQVKKLQMPLQDILLATKGFDEENYIGRGGFGRVYRGVLSLSGRDSTVAVKRLDCTSGQGEREFMMEIGMLSSYRHENLVSLVGFCDESGEKILVYEYASNGSLDKLLHSKDLTWMQRLRICLDAARGLKYLHHDVGTQHRVIHRDIKSSNILLDENWRAKISDFGLSKIGPANLQSTFLITDACGTLGYVDPQYVKTGILTKESDVFSFGVVLFEVLCGRLACIECNDERRFLFKLAQRHYEKETLHEIIDPRLREQMKSTSLDMFSSIAYQCLNKRREGRPTMYFVVEALEDAIDFQEAIPSFHQQPKLLLQGTYHMPSSCTPISLYWTYDVFVSFKGEDTLIVDPLYAALEGKGIYAYKDNRELLKSESINDSKFFNAIEESRFAVVVFSTYYAASSRCLDELSKIMQCKYGKGQTVLPIFYEIEPSDVREQKGPFGKAFDNNKKESMEEVWRESLVQAADLSGYIVNGSESSCIKHIVETISQGLQTISSSLSQELVGLESRFEAVKSLLEAGSNGVRMIGIYGRGGAGKSTVASAAYYRISSDYEGCSFVEKVGEDSRKFGLKTMQEKVLRDVLKVKDTRINSVEEGITMIKDRLSNKRVLVILDDVDDNSQLEALAASHNWFGDGSRIIITSRDLYLLKARTIDAMYYVDLLSYDEAIQLFSRHTFGTNTPKEEYQKPSQEVVNFCGGNPLALKVLGSFLHEGGTNEWETALARSKDIPGDIVSMTEILKISYEGLEGDIKEMFLDIASFFKGKEKDGAMRILDSCGYNSVIGVHALIKRSLIMVSGGRIDMHDLIQYMGRYIVQRAHPHNPERHRRVWQNKEARKMYQRYYHGIVPDILTW